MDTRLIAAKPELAKLLANTCVSPIRLAFDSVGIRLACERAIRLLVDQGFNEFVNYLLFNFNDTPRELYDRLWVNANLNKELSVRITGFPMRFIPTDDVSRRHVAPGWKWRYLRCIQCILLATRGLVSPNPDFIRGAFGESFEQFLQILSVPNRYIICREHCNHDGAVDWKQRHDRLNTGQKAQLLDILCDLNAAPRERPKHIFNLDRALRPIIEHYYPCGKTAAKTPEDEVQSRLGTVIIGDIGSTSPEMVMARSVLASRTSRIR